MLFSVEGPMLYPQIKAFLQIPPRIFLIISNLSIIAEKFSFLLIFKFLCFFKQYYFKALKMFDF